MNRVVAAAGRLQVAFGCAVVLVHHTGHDPARERGNSALRGAADTMLRVQKTRGERLVVSCAKQKDGEAMADLSLRLVQVATGYRDAQGRDVRSCVVEGAAAAGPSTDLTPVQTRVLEAFPAGATQTTTATWRDAAPVPERTFYKIRQDLITGGLVESPQKGTYVLTAKATAILPALQGTATAATTTGFSPAAPAHPLKGVQGSSSLQEEAQEEREEP